MSSEFSETAKDSRGFAVSPVSVMVVCAVALVFIGLMTLFSASANSGRGTYYYLIKQVQGVGLAAVVAVVVSFWNLEWSRRFVGLLALVALGLLVAVLIPHVGVSVNGSRRWLPIGFGVRLQVSEIGKIAMVFCLAHYLALNQTKMEQFWKGFAIPLLMVGLVAGLVGLEPDLGTAALIFAVGLLMIFFAGAKWKYVVPALLAAGTGFAMAILFMPNRLARMTAYMDVEANRQDGTYQLYQSLAAFAMGGNTGVGVGQGRQQMAFLPEAHTDFIFAVLGEELGLVATVGVVLLFITMFVAGYIHLRRAPNMFQYLLVSGCLLLLSLQAIINLGVVTGLLPTKGMSLPFISAGLSNLVLMGIIMGIFINTSRSWARTGFSNRERLMREITS